MERSKQNAFLRLSLVRLFGIFWGRGALVKKQVIYYTAPKGTKSTNKKKSILDTKTKEKIDCDLLTDEHSTGEMPSVNILNADSDESSTFTSSSSSSSSDSSSSNTDSIYGISKEIDRIVKGGV